MSEFTNYPHSYHEVTSGGNTTSWGNLNELLTHSKWSRGAATGYYNIGKIPKPLYLYNFQLDLNKNRHVKQITFEVRLYGLEVDTHAPTAYINYGRNIGHDNEDFTNTIRIENNEQVSQYETTYTYTVDYNQLQLNDITNDVLNSEIFGVILRFPESKLNKSGNIFVRWVDVKVEYEDPSYVLTTEAPLWYRKIDAETKYPQDINAPFYASMQIVNSTKFPFEGGDKLIVDVPFGLHILDVSCTRCSWDAKTSTLILENKAQTIGYKPSIAKFTFKGTTSGYKKVTFHGDDIGSWDAWLYIRKNGQTDPEAEEQVLISTGDCHKGAESLITVNGKTYNSDGTAEFETNILNQSQPYKIVPNLDYCDKSVTVKSIELNKQLITFNVPKDKVVEFSYDVYFIPTSSGNATVEVTSMDDHNTYSYDFIIAEPYDYVFNFNTYDTTVSGGRLVTTITTGSYVLPCRTSESEQKLIVKKPTLNIKRFEDVDYIGCVKLKQTHYEPKSTFKDTLLDTHYKNKRYMGKKGAVDEDISLNVRLPPADVTTIQGLIEMDKPIPINTNHKCFEGDALNHRGWAEIYSIKTEPVGNNPLWYDCDIDVKYITHKLSSRFKITKGSRVTDYFLPNLLKPVYESGCDMGDAFNCTTSGVVTYNADVVDKNRRNIVVLDEGEYYRVKSKNPLGIKSKTSIHWCSTVNSEERDNHVSRIVRLVDNATGNPVFEYEYYDFAHEGEQHSCRVIGRLLYKDTYKVIINRAFQLYNDTTVNPDSSDSVSLYGSELKFELMTNKLTIEDTGISGKELVLEDVELNSGNYYLEVEIKNNNHDEDANPITHYLNFQLSELTINNEYNQYYQNILVSPFPIPGFKIIYTRESEDGTVFYLKDEGNECSYNLAPYYQYQTGVKLESYEGIQLINLENNHEVIYITNGLIRIGFNRLTGRVTLYKFDRTSKQYITISKFQLTKYDDMNINNFTDDKIELQISDTIWTVWRGRPYVKIDHPTEDINFLDTFIRVYGERVGDISSESPTTFELVDNSNLFPVCVGGENLIKGKCITVTSQEYTPTTTPLTLDILNTNNESVTEIGVSQPCRFKVTGSTLTNIKEVCFIVDGNMLPAKDYLIDGVTAYIHYTFTEIGEHTVQAVWATVYGYDYALSEVKTIKVLDDTYKLTAVFDENFYYNQGSFDFLLTHAGTHVGSGKTVNISVNGVDYPKTTNDDGIASLDNHLMIGKYNVTGSFTESEGSVIKAQVSKDVVISKGWCQFKVVNAGGGDIKSNTVRRGTYIVCNLKDTNNTIITEAVLTFTINGVSYTRFTDNNGDARLNINLLAGTYDLLINFAGSNLYESLTKNYELIVVDEVE